MKIYKVSYIAADDLTKHEFFTDKSKANASYKRLQKQQNNTQTDEYGDTELVIKCLFDIIEFDVEVSKKGILNMLNSHFSETQ